MPSSPPPSRRDLDDPAGIFPENVPSIRLHERAGFRVVGRRERLGKLDGVWRDVLLLERRSPVVD